MKKIKLIILVMLTIFVSLTISCNDQVRNAKVVKIKKYRNIDNTVCYVYFNTSNNTFYHTIDLNSSWAHGDNFYPTNMLLLEQQYIETSVFNSEMLSVFNPTDISNISVSADGSMSSTVSTTETSPAESGSDSGSDSGGNSGSDSGGD